jgi:hypothetical protein
MRGGCGNHRCIDAATEFIGVGPGWHGTFRRHPLAGGQQGVDDSDKLHIVPGLQQTRMDASQMTTSHDGYAKSVHAAFLRSRPRP